MRSVVDLRLLILKQPRAQRIQPRRSNSLGDVNCVTIGGSFKRYSTADYFDVIPMEDEVIESRQLVQSDQASSTIIHYDAIMLLAYAAVSAILLITIYLASMAPGTSPAAFALITAFP